MSKYFQLAAAVLVASILWSVDPASKEPPSKDPPAKEKDPAPTKEPTRTGENKDVPDNAQSGGPDPSQNDPVDKAVPNVP
jgi:hypothetical protein